jgi:aminopeptidase N
VSDIFRNGFKTQKTNGFTLEAMGERQYQNMCLDYLSLLGREYDGLITETYYQSEYMTNKVVALGLLCHLDTEIREEALSDFYKQCQHNQVLLNDWFKVQAQSQLPDCLFRLTNLMSHLAFDQTNPDCVLAIYAGLINNKKIFHGESGEGCFFLASGILEIDTYNTVLATTLLVGFRKYPRLVGHQRRLMKEALLIIKNKKGGCLKWF